MIFKHHLLAAMLCGVSVEVLQADVTYVDADFATNTSPGTAVTATVAADGIWSQRGFGTNASVFEVSGNSGAEDAVELSTTLSGLTPFQTYKVWVNFYDPTGAPENWNIRAGFTPGALTLFANNTVGALTSTLPILASSLTYTGTAPKFDDGGNRILQAGELGTATADANGDLVVYIDDAPATIGSNNRTWYDGISFEPVAAPPAGSITYVDATSSNVTRWNGQPFSPAAQGNTTLDDNWEIRALGNAGGIYESNADGPEDAPLLVTSLTGLQPNTPYILYAYFWDDGRNWRLKASAKIEDINDNGTPENLSDDFLPTSPHTHFAGVGNASSTATIAPAAVADSFFIGPLLTEANRALHQASLGKFTSDGSGKLLVYIDDLAEVTEAERVWFDGVGYKLALPLAPTADEDGDGLTNAEEITAGTNPYLVDSDGDSFGDGTEIAAGSDPLNPSSVPPLPGNAVEIAPDGAWTWFNDERSIVHQGSLFSGYVKSNGQYGITRYDLSNGEKYHMIISTGASQQQDDHNNSSITVLPDGKLMVLYSKHIAGAAFYQRTSTVPLPSSNSDWGPEVTVTMPANNTYANTYLLSAEANAIYDFSRCINFNPTLTISTDNGLTWGLSRQLVGTGSGNTRPYPRYTSNGVDRIDLIYTDGHPRDVENSVYHMYYKSGGLYKTDGTLIDSLANIPLDHDAGKRGSVVYQFSNAAWEAGDGPDDWIPTGRGWTWDVHYGQGGNPVCVFQVQVDNAATTGSVPDRIYYYYARWTGSSWQRRFIAQAGRPLYAAEDDYGGGMCLDPEDPRVVYISSNAASPFDLSSTSKVPLRANERYEIWRGFTADGGLTFSWTQITVDSAQDNLRPIVPMHHGRSELLVWFNGIYNSYTSFSTHVLARIGAPQKSFKSWSESYAVPATSPLDSDLDGVDNLVEFALAGDPVDPASRPMAIWQNGAFSFPWPEDRTGIEWIVQESDDLSTWDSVAVLRRAGLPMQIDPGFSLTTAGTDRTAVLTPVGPPPVKRFLRVKVATAE